MTTKDEVIKAALRVCDRWDTPDWKEPIHTGELIHALRQACRAALAEPGPTFKHWRLEVPGWELEPVPNGYALKNKQGYRYWFQKDVDNQQLFLCDFFAEILSTPQPAPAVPQGWKRVPVEPTDAMVEAGINTPVADSGDDSVDRPEDYKAVYRAMLAAAPEAPAVQPLTDEQKRVAVQAIKTTLYKGGSSVQLPADSWIEAAFIEALKAAHGIGAKGDV